MAGERVQYEKLKPLKIVIGGVEYTIDTRDPEDVKSFIIDKAKEIGWVNFLVLVDGQPVAPSELNEVLPEAERIAVFRRDVAAA